MKFANSKNSPMGIAGFSEQSYPDCDRIVSQNLFLGIGKKKIKGWYIFSKNGILF